MDVSEKKIWTYQPKEGEQFFFMHIPKTGGTTFRKMLTNHFPEGSYYPTKADLIGNGGKYFSLKEIVSNNPEILKKNLIMGHFDIKLVKHLYPNVKIIAFFRNPLDRILSHTKHILANDPKWNGADPNLLIREKIKILNLVQSKYMGFERGAFQKVEKNMESIDFVGILEYFDESVELFNEMFNQNLVFISPQNRSSVKFNGISNKTMSLLSRSIIVEVKTYKRAFEHFRRNCKINNINLIV